MSARTTILIVALAVLALLAAPFYLAPFTVTLLNYIGVYSFVALGLVLLTGVAGMVSFGQASFMGIAAYATAWTSALMGYSPWLGLILAVAYKFNEMWSVALGLQAQYMSAAYDIFSNPFGPGGLGGVEALSELAVEVVLAGVAGWVRGPCIGC